MIQSKGIGLDRRIDHEWLDAAAAAVAAGQDRAAIRIELLKLLDSRLSGGKKRGSACYKTVSILSRTWVNVPSNLVDLRNNAIVLLPLLSPHERLALHWSMLMAGYPFFKYLSENVGRLISLQGSLTLSQLTRRMREKWGDRSTMSRATQRLVRSMIQWGALADTEKKGVYARSSTRIAVTGVLAELLLEGLLINEGTAIPVEQTIRHPAIFPFDVSLHTNSLRQSLRFEVHRQGLDVDVVRMVSRESTS